MSEPNAAEASEASRTLGTSRIFDAPPALVWKMWTDPDHVKQWWGPRGFTTTTERMDVRPGGMWTFVMHGPDGTDYPNEIVYREVVEPKRLVYSHGPEPRFDVTVTFEERDGKTLLTMRTVLDSAETLKKLIAEHGAEKGMYEHLDRLGERLANQNAFTISRVFDVPRDLMFRVWTERDHLAKWFGPKGMEISHCTNELRQGGVMHYAMRAPDGSEMWGRWVYREIAPPRLLVFVLSFSDPEKRMTRAPFDDRWPLEMLATITFDEVNGGTRVTVRKAAINAAAAERKTFVEGHESMQMGWTGTFEMLEEYLRTI